MKQLAVVQLLTWLGLFCMWLFFVPATARHVFGATDPQSAAYVQGVEWGGFARNASAFDQSISSSLSGALRERRRFVFMT